MPDGLKIPGVSKTESSLLVLFIPSVDRQSKPIDQRAWEQAALELLGRCFGGATSFPKGRGVWRDDETGGALVYDEPIVVHCYTSLDAIENRLTELHAFLVQQGQAANQGAVGLVLDGTYMEIRFPLGGEATHE